MAIQLRLVPRATLKAKVSPRLTASVVAGPGISVALSGTTYTVAVDESIDLDLDPTLDAMAGLAPVADEIIYFTGADTAARTTLTSYARTLLDDTTAALARGTLGFVTTTSDEAIVRFDGATGATQNSGIGISDSNNMTGVAALGAVQGVFSSQVSSPVVVGGSAVGSTLSLQSTSGVGTTDHIKFLVGNNGATEAARFRTTGRFDIGYAGAGDPSASKLYIESLAFTADHVASIYGQSAEDAVMTNVTLDMYGMTATRDSGTFRAIARQLGATYGHPAGTNLADLRALEGHTLRGSGEPYGHTWAAELGTHSEVSSGWAGGLGSTPARFGAGAYIHSSQGFLSNAGVRSDFGIIVTGDLGFKSGFRYLDTNGTTILFDVDQAGLLFAKNAQFGIAGTSLGTVALTGNTSGTVSIKPQAAAGTYNFNLPTAAGTSGQPLLSGGGGSTAQTYGTLGVAAGGTGDTGTAWTTYAPTVTASSGTFTTVSAAGRYKDIGKTRFITVRVTITTAGTATNTTIVPMPDGTAAAAQAINGYAETTALGVTGNIASGGGSFNLLHATGTTLIADGRTFEISGVIELA